MMCRWHRAWHIRKPSSQIRRSSSDQGLLRLICAFLLSISKSVCRPEIHRIFRTAWLKLVSRPGFCLFFRTASRNSLPVRDFACFPGRHLGIRFPSGISLIFPDGTSEFASRPEIRLFSRTALFSAMQRGGERVENVFCLPQEKGYFATIMVDFYEGDFPGVYYG